MAGTKIDVITSIIAPQSAVAPPQGVVDLWSVPLEADPLDYDPWLEEADRSRAARRLSDDRARFLVRHGALRRIAAGYSDGRVSAEYGRQPQCPGLGLSMTHSDDLAVIAVASVAVGVDLEPCDTIPAGEVEDLAEFVLGAGERAGFARLPRRQRAAALIRAWTRKEAYLKSVGLGIGDRALAEIDVRTDYDGTITLLDIAPSGLDVAGHRQPHVPDLLDAVGLEQRALGLPEADVWSGPATRRQRHLDVPGQQQQGPDDARGVTGRRDRRDENERSGRRRPGIAG